MFKSGEKRRHLFKKGDFVVWNHWKSRSNLLIKDHGIVLKVTKSHRRNIGADGRLLPGRQPIDVWKALVLFSNGEKDELPLVCLKHYGKE